MNFLFCLRLNIIFLIVFSSLELFIRNELNQKLLSLAQGFQDIQQRRSFLKTELKIL